MELKVKELRKENFSEFGTYLNPMEDKKSFNKSGRRSKIFLDKLPLSFTSSSVVSLSVLWLKKRPLEFNFVEAHDYTEEIIGGFDYDVVFHAIPKSEKPDFSKANVFHLPKYNWIRFKRGVWHYEPFPIEGEETMGYVLLPPFTGINDVKTDNINDPIKIIF